MFVQERDKNQIFLFFFPVYMKQKLLFTLNLVLICAIGLGVSASRLTNRPSRPTTTTETSLRSLKAANPTNQNRLTADNRDQLVTEVEKLKNKDTELTQLKTEVEKLKTKVVALEAAKLTTITDELWWRILFRKATFPTPSCPGEWEPVKKFSRFGVGNTTLCKIKHPETVVKIWTTCTKDIESIQQDPFVFAITYKVGEIDAEGKCVKTKNYHFISWEEAERNLNNKPGNQA